MLFGKSFYGINIHHGLFSSLLLNTGSQCTVDQYGESNTLLCTFSSSFFPFCSQTYRMEKEAHEENFKGEIQDESKRRDGDGFNQNMMYVWGWRDSSVVKSTGCTSRGPTWQL